LGLSADQVAMVGDDINNDVLGAQAVGINGVLVRTGKYRPQAVEAAPGEPDLVIDSFAEITPLIDPS
jgi:ribonucleotide monophosphatase NagD (HAD superfamily)